MNKQNDKDLREALRRREARRQKPQPSADFCDSVMLRIGQQDQQPKRRRFWLYPAIGAAAAIAVLLYIGVPPMDAGGCCLAATMPFSVGRKITQKN